MCFHLNKVLHLHLQFFTFECSCTHIQLHNDLCSCGFGVETVNPFFCVNHGHVSVSPFICLFDVLLLLLVICYFVVVIILSLCCNVKVSDFVTQCKYPI